MREQHTDRLACGQRRFVRDEDLVTGKACSRHATQDSANARGRDAAHCQQTGRLGQQPDLQRNQRQRQHATEDQHSTPAMSGDQPTGSKADHRRAQVETGEHDRDQQRAFALRCVLGQQGCRVRHRGTEANTRQQSQQRHGRGRLGKSRRDRENAKQENRRNQYPLAADTIRGGAGR